MRARKKQVGVCASRPRWVHLYAGLAKSSRSTLSANSSSSSGSPCVCEDSSADGAAPNCVEPAADCVRCIGPAGVDSGRGGGEARAAAAAFRAKPSRTAASGHRRISAIWRSSGPCAARTGAGRVSQEGQARAASAIALASADSAPSAPAALSGRDAMAAAAALARK